MIKYCKTCKLFDPYSETCRINGIKVDGNTDYCTKYTIVLETCDWCKKKILQPIVTVLGENKVHLFCSPCASKLSTCQGCKESQVCAFETDPNPLPKIAIKQVQQGPMIAQQQIPNPERQKLFCHNCHCWDGEECIKNSTGQGCEHFKSIWEEIV